MKKNPLFALFLLPLVLAGCGSGKKFTLYTWEGMFPPEIISGFEKETGWRVNYVNFDLDETMLARLRAAKGGDYDLVIADDYIIESAVMEGLVLKLDKSRIPAFGNINPFYQGMFYDPDDEYTVPYGAGIQTIVYDPSRVSIEINGYRELWDPSLRNRIGVTENARVINGIPLKVLGSSYNSEDPDEIGRAGELLQGLAPNIRIIRDDGLQGDLLSGEIDVGVMYTSQATQAMMENPGLRMVYPREGIGYGVMACFIPSRAPNSDAAYAFLNYILDPERGARCFEYQGYYSTFSASDPFIDPGYRALLTLPAEFTANMEMIRNIDPEIGKLHERIWIKFRELSGLAQN